MKKEFKILSPNGILGYGFPEDSFNIGIAQKPDLIAVDAGSTDPGAIKAALPGVTFNGVSGAIAFDDIGDAVRDTAYIKTINTADGAWEFVTQQSAG